ncbi:hypothetical protein F441_21467 [Phytophthora nicotianae CJ01A1]|uniref:Uncharacterized protein n=2 Tax=Phytophthora nicotianae TaxID=4792 RepID=W2HTG3_PHYNI|nr:hypothetical protein L915_20981 [Phytophthora nicotianae]ETL25269.1 hypothetical protein L916_20860 [Phytophthora nicotianae]ETP01261.1 hypothetical protein F441_21467 [Phytophthora nicotianae CJ01A1]
MTTMLKLPWAPGEREFDFACEDVCPLWLVVELLFLWIVYIWGKPHSSCSENQLFSCIFRSGYDNVQTLYCEYLALRSVAIISTYILRSRKRELWRRMIRLEEAGYSNEVI